MMLQISADHGCSRSDRHIWPIHRGLNQAFERHFDASDLIDLDVLGIVFRVSGEIMDFGGEGPERLKHSKRDRDIAIDLLIPESRWKGQSPEAIQAYVIAGVRSCIDQLIAKATELNKLRDPEAYRQKAAAAVSDYLGQ